MTSSFGGHPALVFTVEPHQHTTPFVEGKIQWSHQEVFHISSHHPTLSRGGDGSAFDIFNLILKGHERK